MQFIRRVGLRGEGSVWWVAANTGDIGGNWCSADLLRVSLGHGAASQRVSDDVLCTTALWRRRAVLTSCALAVTTKTDPVYHATRNSKALLRNHRTQQQAAETGLEFSLHPGF
eukprot:1585627-Rhodomonas_salina.2